MAAQAANPLPSVDDALRRFDETVRVPTFFRKLAAAGIVPGSEVEAQDLLDIAERLKAAEANGMIQSQSRFGDVKSALDRHFQTASVDPGALNPSVKRAAAELSHQPEMIAAALAIGQASAEAGV